MTITKTLATANTIVLIITYSLVILTLNQQQHYNSVLCLKPNSNQFSNTGEENESFKAIRLLHTKLDSDADGEVDDHESKKFLESGVGTNNNGYKLKYLHRDGKDPSISVDELWSAWKNSKVYAWSTDETVDWLVNFVELPQHSELFYENSINGTMLPRLATDSHFVSKLGILDPVDKSKISIKAMDVVLFGPPKVASNKFKDTIAYTISIVLIILLYAFYSRLRTAQQNLNLMQSKLHTMTKAEEQLSDLQRKLDDAFKAQEAVVIEKNKTPFQLKQLLQTTYNIESQHLNERKLNLEMKAAEIKIENQKLQKKKQTFLSLYKMAQDNILEENLNTMAEIKEAIAKVLKDICNRNERWRLIEELCGCSLDLKGGQITLTQ